MDSTTDQTIDDGVSLAEASSRATKDKGEDDYPPDEIPDHEQNLKSLTSDDNISTGLECKPTCDKGFQGTEFGDSRSGDNVNDPTNANNDQLSVLFDDSRLDTSVDTEDEPENT